MVVAVGESWDDSVESEDERGVSSFSFRSAAWCGGVWKNVRREVGLAFSF